jgi:L-gulono-1,4-lactone dehydrogenase
VWRNWAGDQSCLPAAVERPASTAEVVAAVERAVAAGHHVRAAGSGHSFTGAALTDGTLVLPLRLDRLLDADRATGLVRV